MKSLHTWLLCLALCAAQTAHAQVPAQLDTMLRRALDSMLIVVNNKSLSASVTYASGTWAHAKGINTTATQVTPGHAYLIGSVTKPFIGACMLQLVNEGFLQLDDSLGNYIDSIPNVNPAITVRQLLQHRSGIADVLANPALNQAMQINPTKVWDAEDVMRLYNTPANNIPNQVWDYSNSNYFLLGMIIKRVTGKPYYQVLRERFFDPQGLSSFTIPAFEPVSVPIAHAWFDLNGDMVLDDAHTWYMNNKALNSVAGAAGGYFATASDLSKLTRSYLRGDLHPPALLAEAKTVLFASGSVGNYYGLGLMRHTLSGTQCFGHGGDLVYSASSWYFPDYDISISVLNNDGSKNSWKLLPVVAALIKTYKTYVTITSTQNVVTAAPSLTVWPNPTQGNATVSYPIDYEPVRLAVTNMAGAIVLEKTAFTSGQQTEIELPHHAAHGMYLVHLWGKNGGVLTQKLVKLP